MQGLTHIADNYQHRKRLTYSVKKLGEPTVEHKGYRSDESQWLLAPRSFASSIGVEPDLCGDEMDYEVPSWPELRPHQEAPVNQVLSLFAPASGKVPPAHDVVLEAYTGSGKTVMGCCIAAHLSMKTLILVDQEKLANQWIATLVSLFGYEKSEIGYIGGGKDEWEGYDFVIGMVQSIYRRADDGYDSDDFFFRFGTVIFDECHVCGAEQFSNVLAMFPAMYRLALSATPDRRDALNKLLMDHVGQHRVVLKEERQQSKVWVLEYKGNVPTWYANISPKDGRFVSELAADPDRNWMIVQAIKWLYEHDRKILVIGARVQHLEELHTLMEMTGVPEEEMVVYTGKTTKWRYAKDRSPDRFPPHWQKDTVFTPVVLVPKESKNKLERLDDRLASSRIVFSTYSVFSKGVDVPGLDAGIDVTPKAAFVQVHGRILRTLSGKLTPIWVTIRDVMSFRAEHQLAQRLKDFGKSNVEIFKWRMPDEVQKCNAAGLSAQCTKNSKRLRLPKIVTNADGRRMLQITS